MKAVNGYIENGRFVSLEVITFPKRIPAVLVYNEAFNDDKNVRMAWLERLHNAAKETSNEDIPDFPQIRFNHKLIDFSNEEY